MNRDRSIASSSQTSFGRSTFDSRTGPFRTSASPHPAASSAFAGNNTSLADAVKHVWGASASPIAPQQKFEQQQRIHDAINKSVSHRVIANSTATATGTNSNKLSTFQQALQGVTQGRNSNNNFLDENNDATPTSGGGPKPIPQFDHHFKGTRVPVLNQPSVAKGDVVECEVSPIRLSALASQRVFSHGKLQREQQEALLRRLSPQKRHEQWQEKMKGQQSSSLLRNLTALNSALGQNVELPQKLVQQGSAGGAANSNNQRREEQQQQPPPPPSTRLTTEALAAAALSKIGGSSSNAQPVVIPALPLTQLNSHQNDESGIAQPLFMQQHNLSARRGGGVTSASSHATTTTSSTSARRSASTGAPYAQHVAAPVPAVSGTASASSSARGGYTNSARRHVDVSGLLPQQQPQAQTQQSWDAFAGTPLARNKQQQSQQTQQQRSRSSSLQQQQQQQHGQIEHLSLPSLFLEQQHHQQQIAPRSASQAVTAAANLFVRTIESDLDFSLQQQQQQQGNMNNGNNSKVNASNMSFLSTVSHIRRTAHAEFAELYQHCENLWAELGTSLASREKASYALFPMLFSGSASSFSSTQLASYRNTITKYIQRLTTQLELTAAANNAMLSRDGAVFDIIAISKRYTDYVRSTFESAGQWRDKEQKHGLAAAGRDPQSAAEAAAATTQATAIKHELRVALHKYRVCTLVAVESIAQWMEFTGRVDFWWQNRPALLHMCVDLHQLAFSRRPLLYLLGFDVVHNPFVLPGEKWYVIPRRERRLQSMSPQRARSVGAAVVSIDRNVNSNSNSSSRGHSQSQNNNHKHNSASATANSGAAWGASKHRAISVTDPRRKEGEGQNFILMNEFGVPLRLESPVVLSSARAASMAAHQKQEQQQAAHHQKLFQQQQQQIHNQHPNRMSNVPDFDIPISATTVSQFWRAMETEEFEFRTRMESALVLMRHAVLQCVVPIQAAVRGLVCRRRYARDRFKIRRLQLAVKEFVRRRELDRAIRVAAARFLFKIWNGYATRFHLRRIRRATLRLQRWWRGTMDRRWLAHRISAAVRLQRWIRPILRKLINRRKRDVRHIQLIHRVCRGYATRRRLCAWAFHLYVSRMKQIRSIMCVERERRVDIEKSYLEESCFGPFSFVSAVSYAASSTSSGSSSSSAGIGSLLLRSDEIKMLPPMLRPVHGLVGAWAQLMLLETFDAFSPGLQRIMLLSCVEEERQHRIKVVQAAEQFNRTTQLVPAKFMLSRVQLKVSYAMSVRELIVESLEPAGRFVIADSFRRERYRMFRASEAESRVLELIRLESMRRNLMVQAEHDVRVKNGLSANSTLLRCDLLEEEERRQIRAVAAQTLALDFLSMLPDFEALRREALAARWQSVVGYFSNSNNQHQHQQQQQQALQSMPSAEFLNALSPFRRQQSTTGSDYYPAFGSPQHTAAAAAAAPHMQIAHQIELLHLSSEEEIARDRLAKQIAAAPGLSFAAKYSLLLRNMARQLAVLNDAQAYAWVKLMSWDGDDSSVVHHEQQQQQQENEQRQEEQRADDANPLFDNNNGDNNTHFAIPSAPQSSHYESRRYQQMKWKQYRQQEQQLPAQRTTLTTSRFTPNIESTTPPPRQRAAIHDFALRHSPAASNNDEHDHDQQEQQQHSSAAASCSSFALVDATTLASANPVLFRALISHARKLQRIGRGYTARSGIMFLLFCESEDRKEIVGDSIASLYLIVEEVKRDKITIAEHELRSKRQQQIRLALGLVETLVKKKERYRLRRMAVQLIWYPLLAQRYNSNVSKQFPAQQQRVMQEETMKRDHIAAAEEVTERSTLLHQCLLSAERAMTVTIRRRWSEHEELVAKARETDANHQRRERVLQDKIYELLMQHETNNNNSNGGSANAEANRQLAKEMAETERIKEMLWGRARAGQVWAHQEKELLVAERGGRSVISDMEVERRAAIGRECAQAVFLQVCSPPRGGVLPPNVLMAGSRAGSKPPVDVESSIFSPEVRQAGRNGANNNNDDDAQQDQEQKDRRFFEWLSARRGLQHPTATYGDIQPLISPPPRAAAAAAIGPIHPVADIGFEEVLPWQRNIPSAPSPPQQQREQQRQQTSNSKHDNSDLFLLNDLTPIRSAVQQQEQEAVSRGAALAEVQRKQRQSEQPQQQQQATHNETALDNVISAQSGISFLSTSGGGVAASPLQFQQDPQQHQQRKQQHNAAPPLASVDSSVAATAVDAITRHVDEPDLFDFGVAAGEDDGNDLWAQHDMMLNGSNTKERSASPEAKNPVVIEVPRAATATAAAKHEPEPMSPPQIIAPREPERRQQQPSEIQQQHSQQQQQQVAVGVPSLSAARASSVGSTTSEGGTRRIVKKVAVVHLQHGNQQFPITASTTTMTMTNRKFASLPRHGSIGREEDDNSEDENNNNKVQQRQQPFLAPPRTASNAVTKEQYEAELRLFANQAVPSPGNPRPANGVHHLDSSRGAVLAADANNNDHNNRVPRGVLRPSSAGAVRSSSNNNLSVSFVDSEQEQGKPTKVTTTTSQSATPQQRRPPSLMSLFQEEQANGSRLIANPTSPRTNNNKTQQQNQSPPLKWTAHAAAMSNRSSDVPDQLERLESFASKVQDSVIQGKLRSSGRATSLLRRASEVMTEEELAAMELERAQQQVQDEMRRGARESQQQQFIEYDGPENLSRGVSSILDSSNSMLSVPRLAKQRAPGTLGLGPVISPKRLRIADAELHHRFFNSNGDPANIALLRSNISQAISGASHLSVHSAPSMSPKSQRERDVERIQSEEYSRGAHAKIISPLTEGGAHVKKVAAMRRQVQIEQQENVAPQSLSPARGGGGGSSSARGILKQSQQQQQQQQSASGSSIGGSSPSPTRKNVSFTSGSNAAPQLKVVSPPPQSSNNNKIVLRRASEVMTPPEKPREPSPPFIQVQSPSLPRGGNNDRGGGGGSNNTSAVNLSVSYKPDLPLKFYF